MIKPQDVKQWIEDGLEDARVEIEGDGQHFFAVVVSPAFDGLSRIRRHQLVYGALGERMRSEIHALSMRTLTPAEHEGEGQAAGSPR